MTTSPDFTNVSHLNKKRHSLMHRNDQQVYYFSSRLDRIAVAVDSKYGLLPIDVLRKTYSLLCTSTQIDLPFDWNSILVKVLHDAQELTLASKRLHQTHKAQQDATYQSINNTVQSNDANLAENIDSVVSILLELERSTLLSLILAASSDCKVALVLLLNISRAVHVSLNACIPIPIDIEAPKLNKKSFKNVINQLLKNKQRNTIIQKNSSHENLNHASKLFIFSMGIYLDAIISILSSSMPKSAQESNLLTASCMLYNNSTLSNLNTSRSSDLNHNGSQEEIKNCHTPSAKRVSVSQY